MDHSPVSKALGNCHGLAVLDPRGDSGETGVPEYCGGNGREEVGELGKGGRRDEGGLG